MSIYLLSRSRERWRKSFVVDEVQPWSASLGQYHEDERIWIWFRSLNLFGSLAKDFRVVQ